MAHFLPHSMGEEWEWKDKGNEDMGSTMKKKKSDTFIFVYCINVWLVEGKFVYLFVKIIH